MQDQSFAIVLTVSQICLKTEVKSPYFDKYKENSVYDYILRKSTLFKNNTRIAMLKVFYFTTLPFTLS